MQEKINSNLSDLLIIVGSGSHILKGYQPPCENKLIIKADRENSDKRFSNKEFFVKYDLKNDDRNEIDLIEKIYELSPNKIDILFASYSSKGLEKNSSISEISESLKANIGKPLKLFSTLSDKFNNNVISGVFISSMYAKVSPNKFIYDSPEEVNPLFYGAAKAAVEQGIKWLSCQNDKHRFNSITLGAMPKKKAQESQPTLMKNLKKRIPSGRFVKHEELFETINFIFNEKCKSLRGENIVLDGGYTIW